MGKISDALERHKKEKFVNTERLPINKRRENIRELSKPFSGQEAFMQQGFSPKLVVISAPESKDAENFKLVRTQILFPKDEVRPKTILLTSAFPGEGKTFAASNLAVSIALSINEHVLLIDCDLRKPELHKMFGYSNERGLNDYLTGKKRLSDLLIRTSIEKLTILTAGSPSSNPSELLSSTNMKSFLEEAKERYQDRYIIIDGPPSQIAAESDVLANYVDGILLVVMAKKSPRELIQRTIDNIGKDKILGVIFNGYSQSYKTYHKYYKKYYK